MALADNKRNVFTTIGAYTSFMQQGKSPKRTDLYPSVNNKKDAVPFLLDVLKTVAGSEALKELIGGMLTKLVDNVEPKLKVALKKQFIQSNSGNDLMGSNFSTAGSGVTMKVKDIDPYGKFKLNPTSSDGSLLYDTSKPNFDRTAYNAILNDGSEQTYLNMKIKYDSINDSFTFKPTADVKIGDFFADYIDDAEIINKKELITNVMDRIYGTMSAKQKKTVEQVYSELEIELLLQQALNEDDSFEIPTKDYDELLKKAQETALGVVNYDMGCGLMSASLSFDSLNDLITVTSGSTDPFVVGNAVEATIDASTSGNSTTQAITAENKATIKDGFFQRLINIFTVKLLQALTTAPQVRALLAVSSSLENNGVVIMSSPKEDMKKCRTFIMCMTKEIMRLIAEFIFALVVAFLIKLLTPVIKRILKEKINQYVKIIKSLTPAGKLI